MAEFVPMKYLKTDWGLIALFSRFDEEGNPIPFQLSEDVRAEVYKEGVMGVVTGNILLPIPENLLDFVIQNPVIQLSFLTDKLVDEEHVVVNLSPPSLYELKGLWRASANQLQQNQV